MLRYLIFFIPFILFAQSQTDFERAEFFFKQEKYSRAQPLFLNVIKENPSHLKATEYLGDIEGMSQNWLLALKYYQKLKELRPSNANYVYKYGGVLGMIAKESNKLKALGMIGEIKESFEKAIELNPKHIEARWALIELYLQLPGIVGGSERKAKFYASELSVISPVDGFLANGKIAEYFERYKEAEKHYLNAIKVGTSKLCYQKLSDLYKNKLNQPEKAIKILAEYNEKNKS